MLSHTRNSLNCLIAAVILILAASGAHAEKIKRKGRFLHSEIEAFEDKPSFSVFLVPNTESSHIVFKINKLVDRTIHEVKVYEMVYEELNTADNGQTIALNAKPPQVIPNEFIRDDRTTRHETIKSGPCSNTTFLFDDQMLTTDENGLAYDLTQNWIDKFDDLTANVIDINVRNEKLGTKSITLSRYIIASEDKKVPNYKLEDTNATYDILEGLGLDFKIPDNTGKTTLDISCNMPESAAAADVIPVTVTVSNKGVATSGNLIVATFSRENWLDGKVFYFGKLEPGESRSFTRYFTVPVEASRTAVSTVAFSSWDTVRPQPEAHCLKIIKRQR